MFDATTIPPMPDTHCPTWCEADHAAAWADKVVLFTAPASIPMADGTVAHPAPWTLEEIVEDFLDMENHNVTVLDLQPGEPNSYRVGLDISQGHLEEVGLYLAADSPLTTAEARQVAGALLAAADRVDELARS